MSGAGKPGARFDGFSANYKELHQKNLGVLGGKIEVFAQYKLDLMAELLPFRPRAILEFGCGVGNNLRLFPLYFPEATLHGCDISADSLGKALELTPGATGFVSSSPDTLTPYRGAFDLVFIACVLHHIPVAQRQGWIDALAQTLRPGGRLAIFEHNPWNPVTRHLVNTCPFDEDAVLLRAGEAMRLAVGAGLTPQRPRYRLLTPWRHPAFVAAERLLDRLPLGGQYCLLAAAAGPAL